MKCTLKCSSRIRKIPLEGHSPFGPFPIHHPIKNLARNVSRAPLWLSAGLLTITVPHIRDDLSHYIMDASCIIKYRPILCYHA